MSTSAYNLLWAIPAYSAIFIGIHVWPGGWVALLGFHLALIVPLLPRLRALPPLFLVPISPYLLLLMAFAGLFGGIGLWTVWPYTGASENYQANLLRLGMDSNFSWGLFIAYFSLINPWIEEAFWRNALNNPTRGPALVDFVFAGFHIIIIDTFVGPFWLLVALLIIASTGWLWRTVTRLTGSLLPATVFHIVADFSIVWVVYQKSL